MDDETFFKSLAEALGTPGMPTQAVLAKAAGVDQPLVSRATRKELRRITPRVTRLAEYASMRAGLLRRHSTPDSTRKNLGFLESAPPPFYPEQAVMDECRAYLAEGGDASLLHDQIAILRRAQKRP